MKYKQNLIIYICLILLILTNCTKNTTEQDLGCINLTTSTEAYQGGVNASIDVYAHSDSVSINNAKDLQKLKRYKKYKFDLSESGNYKLDGLEEGVYNISIFTYVPRNIYSDELILPICYSKVEFKTVILLKVVINSSNPRNIHIEIKRRTYERFESPQIIRFGN